MAELRFKLSPTKKIPFKLIGDLTTIGRDPNNSIVIDHPSVSPFHAEILLVHSEDRYEVFDLGSPHGTKVNEEQVIRKELEDGDEIKFGQLAAEIIIASSELKEQENQPAEQSSNKEKSTAAARAASRPASPKLVKEPPTKKLEKAKVTEKEAAKFKVKTSKNDSFGEAKVDSFSKDQLLEIDQLKKELEESKQHISNLKSSNKKLKQEVDKKFTASHLKGDLKKFKKRNKSLKKEASALRSKIKKREDKLEELSQREAEFKTLIDSIESLEKESSRLSKQNESHKLRNVEIKKKHKKEESDILIALKNAESAASEKIKIANEKAKTALEELEADIQQIKDAREASKVLLVEKQKAIKVAETEHLRHSDELEKVRVLRDEIEEEFTELTNNYSSLKEEVSEAQKAKTKLDNKYKEESQKYNSEIQNLKSENDQLIETKESLNADVSLLKADQEELKDVTSNLSQAQKRFDEKTKTLKNIETSITEATIKNNQLKE